ncbi:hypothetical protein BC830DRAFT_1082165 [Chytriomyces sp. MP71]|nr:hypothetical protein BC830DRAFT_1082165 [Chytriomyces sp. MP71]
MYEESSPEFALSLKFLFEVQAVVVLTLTLILFWEWVEVSLVLVNGRKRMCSEESLSGTFVKSVIRVPSPEEAPMPSGVFMTLVKFPKIFYPRSTKISAFICGTRS